jgi:Acyl-CoA dehydrogenase, middle domain
MMSGPVVIDHGTEARRERWLGRLAAGLESWCQLFSEPGAGSDLAGLQTRSVRDGDLLVANGQKVWTSGAATADRGMLTARTTQVPHEERTSLAHHVGPHRSYFPRFNYAQRDLEPTRELLEHPHTVIGLSDGGAHRRLICDAGAPTSLLTHRGSGRCPGTSDCRTTPARPKTARRRPAGTDG